jgi:hypothetical protein
MLIVTAAGLAACGGGGGGDKLGYNDLKAQLPNAAKVFPGFQPERRLDWSNAFNLVGEGILLPEKTRPADAMAHVQDAGFKGGAGEWFTRGTGPDRSEWRAGVVKLGSAAKANALRDWMHSQDLQQPCYTECIFSPQNVKLTGVPNSRFVQHVPNLPPGPGGPPHHYLLEFTVGPYLYFASGDGDAKAKAQVVRGAQAYYNQVRGRTS